MRAIRRGLTLVCVVGLCFLSARGVMSVGSPDVLTYHNDVARTGQNLNELLLTPARVTAAGFGKTGFFATDGKVDAQPLYLANVNVPSAGLRNVVYVATAH